MTFIIVSIQLSDEQKESIVESNAPEKKLILDAGAGAQKDTDNTFVVEANKTIH